MRKVLVAGVATAVLAVAAVAVVRSQTRYADEKGDRRVVMLDGRGSAIGVSIRDLETDDVTKAKLERAGGVVIEEVEEDGPADKAGLRAGDIVVDFDGERVRSARHFGRLVQETPAGRTVRATIVREGARQNVDLTPSRGAGAWSGGAFSLPEIAGDIEREVERGMRSLPRDLAFDFKWDGELPSARVWPRGRLGAELSPLTDQLAQYFGAMQGVLVSSVDPDSVAAKAGLKAGDVITEINGQPVDSARDIAQELRRSDADAEVALTVLRDKKSMTVKAQLPEPRKRPITRRPTRPA